MTDSGTRRDINPGIPTGATPTPRRPRAPSAFECIVMRLRLMSRVTLHRRYPVIVRMPDICLGCSASDELRNR
jgi:hypothetical protein